MQKRPRWVFLYRWRGNLTEMGLGGFHSVSLARARELATAYRTDLATGINPKEKRDRDRDGTRGVPTCVDPYGKEPEQISVHAVNAAAARMESYFIPMAERVYGDAAIPAVDLAAMVLVKYLRKSGLSTFNARMARREIGGTLRNASARIEPSLLGDLLVIADAQNRLSPRLLVTY